MSAGFADARRKSLTVNEVGPRLVREPGLTPLGPSRMAAAKISFATRRVPVSAMNCLLTGDIRPEAGDVVFAKILRLGQHPRLQLPTGRRARLYPGNEIVVCYANRHAAHQFEAVVPDTLAPCSLAAGGGIASMVVSSHDTMKAPTMIEPLGLIADKQGKRLNLKDFAMAARDVVPGYRPFVIAIVGTEMDSGKTTAASQLIRGCVAAGTTVASGKVTGTGAGGDYWEMVDAGADPVLDFTDMGFASTWGIDGSQIDTLYSSLLGHLFESKPDVVILEVADGLFQTETVQIIEHPLFKETIDCIVLTATDAVGATGGVNWLRQRGLPIVAVSGVVSASALGRRAVKKETGLPTLGRSDLANPETIYRLLPRIPNITVPTLVAAGHVDNTALLAGE